MANPPPPYENITGISRTVMKDNAQESIANYNGNARPGEIVVDQLNNNVYIGNTNGNLNLLVIGGGSGNSEPAGPVGAIQYNSGGNLFGGTANVTVSGTGISVVGNVTAGNIVANTIVSNGSGNIYITGNLLPSAGTLNLGLPTVPWQDAYFGPQSITILDSTGNIGNSVVIENIAANIVLGTTGFTINRFGTTTAVFRIEAITGQIFSNAETIIANVNNSSNVTSGSLQTAGGAGIAKNLYVGNNIVAIGNITGNYILGNGSQLTGLVAPVNANWTSTSGLSQILNKTGASGPTTIALGQNAVGNVQGANAIAIGVGAAGSATTSQGVDAIAIGTNAGGALAKAQGDGTIAIGKNAGGAGFGTDGQQTWSIAVGTEAGTSNQAAYSVALGAYAGRYNQGSYATALGQAAGLQSQGTGAVAIGQAGNESQGQYAVAIGSGAGDTNQGNNAIAIGYQAGTNNQTANSIILNASGSALDSSGVAGLFINPVRNNLSSNANVVFFNTSTKELTYANTISLAGNVTGGNILTSGNLSVSGNTNLGNVITAPQITKASNATGTTGQICWDANYIYVCTATNTWKRSPLTGGY